WADSWSYHATFYCKCNRRPLSPLDKYDRNPYVTSTVKGLNCHAEIHLQAVFCGIPERRGLSRQDHGDDLRRHGIRMPALQASVEVSPDYQAARLCLPALRR